jgi:hypothetical protein
MESADNIPKVIVTDMDITLMNDVAVVFPKTTTLVSQFHITKNARVKCIIKVDGRYKEVKHVKVVELVDNIMKVGENMVESLSTETYARAYCNYEMSVRNAISSLPMLKVSS